MAASGGPQPQPQAHLAEPPYVSVQRRRTAPGDLLPLGVPWTGQHLGWWVRVRWRCVCWQLRRALSGQACKHCSRATLALSASNRLASCPLSACGKQALHATLPFQIPVRLTASWASGSQSFGSRWCCRNARTGAAPCHTFVDRGLGLVLSRWSAVECWGVASAKCRSTSFVLQASRG